MILLGISNSFEKSKVKFKEIHLENADMWNVEKRKSIVISGRAKPLKWKLNSTLTSHK